MAKSFLIRVITATVIVHTAGAANFDKCYDTVVNLLTDNNTIARDSNRSLNGLGFADPIYHGFIRGLHADAEYRPVTLTYEGCKAVCSKGSDPYDTAAAFQILTTWVLPVLALLSSLPYESNTRFKNFEAFANWIGSPAAALCTTIWNLVMIRRCQQKTEEDPDIQPITKECLFILSCVNQYEYRRRWNEGDTVRDITLLRGTLYPYLKHPALQKGQLLRRKLDNITVHLAFQLRLQRRRGVFPMVFSILWFLLAFVISIVTAFSELGDNTTAHSLAIGLLLSWLPVLVVAAVVDRNPVSADRCGILIERWLYTVHALCNEAGLSEGEDSRYEGFTFQINDLPLQQDLRYSNDHETHHMTNGNFNCDTQGNEIQMAPLLYNTYSADDADDERPGFVPPVSPLGNDRPRHPSLSQGSTMHYPDRLSVPNMGQSSRSSTTYSESDIAAERMNEVRRNRRKSSAIAGCSAIAFQNTQQWHPDADASPFEIQDFVGQGRRLRYCAVTDTVLDMYEDGSVDGVLPTVECAKKFKRRLVQRPWKWYIAWLVSQLIVTTAFTMAFVVSFNTPTIGLGCRSLAYLIWWLLSLISWVTLLIWQEPPTAVRVLSYLPNILAFLALFAIMGLQLSGGLNNCYCKSSMSGSSAYGGYMDFENGSFYRKSYDVEKYWALATALGMASCTSAIMWLYRRWSRNSVLCKVKEDYKPKLMDGIDLRWLS